MATTEQTNIIAPVTPTTLTGAKKTIAFAVIGTLSVLSLVGAFSPAARDYVVAISKAMLPILEIFTK